MPSKSIFIKHKWKTINGIKMHARIANTNRPTLTPIVLVHGLSVSSRYMIPIINVLSRDYPIYAPDLPGFGKSDKSNQTYKISELADFLASWMKSMRIKKAIFLGNSLGCQTIVDLCLRYKNIATHIVLIGPTTDPKARTLHQAAYRLFLDMFHEPMSYFPVMIKEYLDAGPKRTIQTLNYGFEGKLEEKATKVLIPTLIVRGKNDTIVPRKWTEKLHTLFPNSTSVEIPNAGHVVNFNSPHQLAKEVKAFLKQ